MHVSVCMRDIHQMQQACACVNVLLCKGRKVALMRQECCTRRRYRQACTPSTHSLCTRSMVVMWGNGTHKGDPNMNLITQYGMRLLALGLRLGLGLIL